MQDIQPHHGADLRFPARERRQLLSERGIGPQVVERLEQAGIDSLDRLRCVGVAGAVDAICAVVGSQAWANRRRAIERALGRSAGMA